MQITCILNSWGFSSPPPAETVTWQISNNREVGNLPVGTRTGWPTGELDAGVGRMYVGFNIYLQGTECTTARRRKGTPTSVLCEVSYDVRCDQVMGDGWVRGRRAERQGWSGWVGRYMVWWWRGQHTADSRIKVAGSVRTNLELSRTGTPRMQLPFDTNRNACSFQIFRKRIKNTSFHI